MIRLMEQFYTLQGEGVFTGHPAYFIRLGGCDVGCVWCDVKESWPAEAHPFVDESAIAEAAFQSGAPIAVVTGGEPLMQPLDQLTAALKTKGLRTHLETSASSSISGTWDWICVSPKKFKSPIPDILKQAHELKVVVYNRHDLEWAQTFIDQVSPECHLLLQPEWDKSASVLPMVLDFIKTHPTWSLSLQTHKYIHIP